MCTLGNMMKFRQLIQPVCCGRLVTVRHIYSHLSLGMNGYTHDRTTLQKSIGPNKGKFFEQLRLTVERNEPIFTRDIRASLLLADSEKEIDLTLRAVDNYKEHQKEALFPTSFKCAEEVLRMLFFSNRRDLALKWFTNERSTIRHDAANLMCFQLMMTMFYMEQRYDDMIELMANIDVYIHKPHVLLLVPYFAALYNKNTSTALSQCVSRLQDCMEKKISLPKRCVLYSSLLAYNQGDIRAMMEIMELPVFHGFKPKQFMAVDSLQILANIELGRLEECITSLHGLLKFNTKNHSIIFKDVIVKLAAAVEKTDSVQMKADFEILRQALQRTDNIKDVTVAEYVDTPISPREMETYFTLNDQKNHLAWKGFKTLSGPSDVGQKLVKNEKLSSLEN